MKLIENTTFDEDNEHRDLEAKKDYAKLLRAHLNSSEVKLLMFNCVSERGLKLKPLIVNYAMLKHLNSEDEKLNLIVWQAYPKKAFSR